jgi:hypothetical protein
MKIQEWINGYSNCGTKIQTAAIKNELQRLQEQHPERNYQLVRQDRLWFIAEGKTN